MPPFGWFAHYPHEEVRDVDAELERVLAELEVRFDSELARREEEEANGLAAGLRQDRLLRSELARSATALLVSGGRQDVTVVGRDYAGAGWPLSCVTKIERAVVVLQPGGGSPPLSRDDSFIEVIRRWQRAALRVELDVGPAERVVGQLERVAADHVLVRTTPGQVIVPLPVIVAVRLVRGG